MVKEHKLVFNLSLKDLKELGILKSKRKKRKSRRRKILDSVYASQTRTQPNLNGYGFTNQMSVNADTDRLKNELVQLQIQQAKEKPLMIETQLPQIENPKLLQIQDDLNKFRDSHNRLNNAAGYVYNEYKDRFNKIENKINGLSSIPSQTMNETNYENHTDNIDETQTPGSEYFVNANDIKSDENQERLKEEQARVADFLSSSFTGTEHPDDNDDDYEEMTFKPAPPPAIEEEEQPIKEEHITDIVDKKKLSEARRQYTNICNSIGKQVNRSIYKSTDIDLIKKTTQEIRDSKTKKSHLI
jgi:hypothetical protein